ncbi:2-amino-4-hydroxy-6-hydroxymethyldihydropteridine diphosphokinase [Haematobacter missouriensis]|uniref:2-amino-4-hydroxy-6-hydroxymethyldihydropteridine pyrophosphokinase n=1 Tax=Haematobacter missouriensis TaxID=366616 RepID=A0A212ATY8_9RHOB|nr:2-amino-4-hydroxy-6-hydroxymethyldihydropteridine diphosphokinase [Haematobacter missouriensis]OWJ75764.1 2-amino-4-hydroxy-6-hydroxymethyldihydropteridine diphosphokinase [Haematobacter missouriensis]OWJ84953.1 2-amino-4-hydroxy-6-hydroxymethyldihydropteridine diphosphokinase [Haematobacter missouriensis]
MTQAFVALGSNLTSRNAAPPAILSTAVKLLNAKGVVPTSLSLLYKTPAYPAGSGPDFVNAVIAAEVGDLLPAEVLSRLHMVESALGRERSVRWGARTADLDLIAMGNAVLPEETTWRRWRDLSPARQRQEAPDTLVLPHPRLQDRAFVLVPMADVAGDWRHPVTRLSVAEMLESLPEAERWGVVPLAAPPEEWRL